MDRDNIWDRVEKAYAVQAGRELRVIVKPEEVDDLKAHKIARDIKEEIEDMGNVDLNVSRETFEGGEE